MYMRRKCQECRLKKCLSVGMRPECVVPEYQCAIKRESKRAQKAKDTPNSTTKDHHGNGGSMSMHDKDEKPVLLGNQVVVNGAGNGGGNSGAGSMNGVGGQHNGGSGSNALGIATGNHSNHSATSHLLSNGVKPLTADQENMIKKLVFYQEEFESPSDEDVKKITVSLLFMLLPFPSLPSWLDLEPPFFF